MFSSAAKLADLDDFLTPSQECVVSKTAEEGGARPGLIRPAGPEQTAQVSLYDCLACSGCVTSAEAILIESQNAEDFFKVVGSGTHTVVVSISPQTRTAFAARLGVSSFEALTRLSGLFKGLGATYVFEMSTAEAVNLELTAREFVAACRCRLAGGESLPDDFPAFLTSHCPGWVCYAEKTLPAAALSQISRVMSSQQIQGALVKTLVPVWYPARAKAAAARQAALLGAPFTALRLGARRRAEGGAPPPPLYHVCVMPCYDKKLEAVRPECAQDGVPDVDLVLASSEVARLLDALETPPPPCVDR
eukprot:Polyplicarium_translucidae@DN2604_c0_g1_i2.p1